MGNAKIHNNISQMSKAYYAELLRKNGRRVTKTRLAVMNALHDSTGHITLGDINKILEQNGNAVYLSTLYRVLADLRDDGIIAETIFPTGEVSYEWIVDSEHHHLHCVECGALFILPADVLSLFLQGLRIQFNFTPDVSHFVIPGRCGDCEIITSQSEVMEK